MPRTKKKTPSSQSLAADATTGPVETPKGSGLSVPPVRLEERVAVPVTTIGTPRELPSALERMAGLRSTICAAGHPGQDHTLVCLDCGATCSSQGFCHNGSEIVLSAPVLRALDALATELDVDRVRLVHDLLALGMAVLWKGGSHVALLGMGMVERLEEEAVAAARAGA